MEKKLFKSIAAFQQEVPIIQKDTKTKYYAYADLPKVFEIINPILKKYNLGFIQPIEGNIIKTIIFHTETGETIESVIEIPQGVDLQGMNVYQSLGAGITYMRRYAISSLLGLVTDKDTDANGVAPKPTKTPPPPKKEETPKPTKTPPPPKKEEPTKQSITDKNLFDAINLNPTKATFREIVQKYQLTEEQSKKTGEIYYELFPEEKKKKENQTKK